MERRVFDNGLVAIAESLNGKQKAQILVGMDVGAKNESSEKKGGLHLLEHRMFGSNDKISSLEFAESAEFEGMRLTAYTSHLETIYDCWTPGTKIENAVQLVFSLATNRSYNIEEFVRERDGIVKTELITYERFPYRRFIQRVLLPEIFKGTLLEDDIIGTPKSVKSLELLDLLHLKEKFYVPNNTKVVAVGAVDTEKFFEAVGKTFGSSNDGVWNYSIVEQPNLTWKLEPRVVYREFPDLKDPEDPEMDGAIAYIAYQVNPRSHPDEIGLYLLDTTIGQGFTSYLSKELREKRGIGYSLESDYLSMRGNGVFILGVPMLIPHQIDETIDTMLGIVEELRTKPLTEKYLIGNKTKFMSLYEDLLDYSESRAQQRVDRELETHHHDLMDIPKKIESMSAGELQDIARRNFSGHPLIVIASAPGYQNRYSRLATK